MLGHTGREGVTRGSGGGVSLDPAGNGTSWQGHFPIGYNLIEINRLRPKEEQP